MNPNWYIGRIDKQAKIIKPHRHIEEEQKINHTGKGLCGIFIPVKVGNQCEKRDEYTIVLFGAVSGHDLCPGSIVIIKPDGCYSFIINWFESTIAGKYYIVFNINLSRNFFK